MTMLEELVQRYGEESQGEKRDRYLRAFNIAYEETFSSLVAESLTYADGFICRVEGDYYGVDFSFKGHRYQLFMQFNKGWYLRRYGQPETYCVLSNTAVHTSMKDRDKRFYRALNSIHNGLMEE